MNRNLNQSALRVLCVNQYYWPNAAATSQLLQDLAEDLVRAGHDVTVVCSRAPYVDEANEHARGLRAAQETHNNVRILRVTGSKFGRSSGWGRVADYLTFYVSAVTTILRVKHVDVLLVETTPPLILIGSALAAWVRKVPIVHVVQDLYPEVAEALGIMKPGSIVSALFHHAHRWALCRCDVVVALGRDMALELESAYRIPKGLLQIIPNWADGAALECQTSAITSLRKTWALGARKIVMYSGNLGRAHSYEEFLSVAQRWNLKEDVAFVFVGGGQSWWAAKRSAETLGLSNTRFLPYQQRGLLGASLALGDVHLVSQRPETTGLLVPSKLYGILAVGRPVVFVGSTGAEVARVLAEIGAGLTVEPGDVDGLESALHSFLSNSLACERAAEAGRDYMRRFGERGLRTQQYRRLLERAAAMTP